MEHKMVQGGDEYLPFARSRIKALRTTGLKYASQAFEIGGAQVRVRIAGDQEYIEIESGSGIVWFRTRLSVVVAATPNGGGHVATQSVVYRSLVFRLDHFSAKRAKLYHRGADSSQSSETATLVYTTADRGPGAPNDQTSTFADVGYDGDCVRRVYASGQTAALYMGSTDQNLGEYVRISGSNYDYINYQGERTGSTYDASGTAKLRYKGVTYSFTTSRHNETSRIVDTTSYPVVVTTTASSTTSGDPFPAGVGFFPKLTYVTARATAPVVPPTTHQWGGNRFEVVPARVSPFPWQQDKYGPDWAQDSDDYGTVYRRQPGPELLLYAPKTFEHSRRSFALSYELFVRLGGRLGYAWCLEVIRNKVGYGVEILATLDVREIPAIAADPDLLYGLNHCSISDVVGSRGLLMDAMYATLSFLTASGRTATLEVGIALDQAALARGDTDLKLIPARPPG